MSLRPETTRLPLGQTIPTWLTTEPSPRSWPVHDAEPQAQWKPLWI